MFDVRTPKVLRKWFGLEVQTADEKRAASSGMSLFFGALIGANLGTTAQMALGDYVLVIAVVCLIILYIHLAPVAQKRWKSLAHLTALVCGLYVLLVHPVGANVFAGERPSAQIFATICLWLTSIAMIELRPVAQGGLGSVSAPPTQATVNEA